MKPAFRVRLAHGAGLSITLALASAALAQTAPLGTMTSQGTAGLDQQLVTTARSAAPSPISGQATIAVAENGKLRTLTEGSNGWTCLPSFAGAPGQTGNDMVGKPICVDQSAAWLRYLRNTRTRLCLRVLSCRPLRRLRSV